MFYSKKRITAILLLIILVMTFASVGANAAIPSNGDDTEVRKTFFDYDDGIVRDGSVGDNAGVIGDEYDSAYVDPRSDMTGDDKEAVDGRVAGVTDSADDQSAAFWGVVISLAVGAAAILIAVFALPGRDSDRSGGR